MAKKIMVIDDDQKIRQIVCRFLEQRGYQVTLVSDGSLGMEAIKRERPDLIILDVLMPGLDGCALGYHIKYESEFSHIPIIMMTSLTHRSYLAKDIAAECFLPKPFSGEELVANVENVLSRGVFKVGYKRPRIYEADIKKMKREATLTPMSRCLAIMAFFLFVMAYFTNPAVEQTTLNAWNDARAVSAMADRLFIYLVPIGIGIMAYAVVLLRKALIIPEKEGWAIEGRTEKHTSR